MICKRKVVKKFKGKFFLTFGPFSPNISFLKFRLDYGRLRYIVTEYIEKQLRHISLD